MNRRDKQLQEQLMQKTKKQTTEIVVSSYLSTMTVVLKKEFGFGKNRTEKLIESMMKEFKSLSSGMIGYEDYMKYVEETTKVNLTKYMREG